MARVILPTGNAATQYGPRGFETQLPAQYVSSQGDKVQSITFSYDTLPSASTNDDSVLLIPANSYVVSAILRVTTAFAGGTSYNIGLEETDGTAIDVDGLFAALALAAIDAVGETAIGGGALIGLAAGTGSAAGQVVFAETGTFTAGEATLEVVYRTLDDRASF
jgi:hypothetical protein